MNTLDRSIAVALAVLLLGVVAGCASSPPAPPPPRPTLAPGGLDGVRRVVIVSSGESRFAVLGESKERDRTMEAVDEVLKWIPFKNILVPIARAVYLGVTALLDSERAASTVPKDVTPTAVVAEAFARTLHVSGPFNQIVPLDREPVGDERRQTDAIIRVSVPSWGLMRVREGTGPQVAGFADVRAEMVLRETGVVVWQHDEDVTHPDRVALDTLKRDRALTRQELVDVLERAGQRLGNELVYAWGARR
jgi:hypothetical protein